MLKPFKKKSKNSFYERLIFTGKCFLNKASTYKENCVYHYPINHIIDTKSYKCIFFHFCSVRDSKWTIP